MRVRISSRRLLKRNATESLTVRRTRARRRPRHAAIDANGNALAPEPSRPVVAEEEEEEDIDDDMHESGQESDQEDQEVDQEEDQVAAEEAVDRMPDYFPLHASLSLLLCATTLLLEPVSAADLVAWAQRGEVGRRRGTFVVSLVCCIRCAFIWCWCALYISIWVSNSNFG